MHTAAELPRGEHQTIEAALEDWVSRGALWVPPYPAVAMRVQEVLAAANYTTAQLAGAMRTDPVFAANLLRLANSPFYRRGAEVTSLAVAVQRIGARELARLAMASALSGLSAFPGPLHGLRRQLWRQALSSALLCEALAHLEGGDEGEAFVAGLLHDAGKLMVVRAIEQAGRERGDSKTSESAAAPAVDEVRLAIERFHVRLGEALAQHWHLPGLIGAVVATHHDAPATLGPLTRRVVLVDAVVKLMEGQIEVSALDLERVGVPPAFAAPLASVIPRVPPTLAAFEGEKEPLGTELLRPQRWEGPIFVEVTGESARPWPLVRAREDALEVLAPRPLAEGLLLEVTLGPDPLRFWALVGRCERRGQAWAAELVPYALSQADGERWRALAAQTRGLEAA